MPALDPVVPPDALNRCACGAEGLHRPVLLEQGIVRACLACGAVQALVTEWSYSDNPHVAPEAGVTRALGLDAEARDWLSSLPRVATGASAEGSGPYFLAPDVRVADAVELALREREAVREAAPTLGERLRRAGAILPPPRRDIRFELEPYLIVQAASSLAGAPIDDVLALLGSAVPLAARLAREALDSRPDAALALAERLSELTAAPFENEAAISRILRVLAGMGSAAAPAHDAVRALGQSELASRRSTIRDDVERLLTALGA